MHLVLYGPEGSGKGTQADLLSKKFHLPIYTSGDLVRYAAQQDSREIGDACRDSLALGRYVSDKIMFVLWEEKLKEDQAKKGFILDGFPRTLSQAQFLQQKLHENNYSLDAFIHLNLSDEDAARRLSLRSRKLYEGSLINHDDPDRVSKRLSEFRSHENEIVQFYKNNNILIEVDANKIVDQVFNEITSLISSLS